MLLGIVAASLLIPLVATQLSSVADAGASVERTDAVTAEIRELDDLLRLGPAVMAESVAQTSAFGLGSLAIAAPDVVPQSTIDEFVEMGRASQATVDELLERIDDAAWTDLVADLRSEIADGTIALTDIGERYEAVRVEAEQRAIDRVRELNRRASAVMDPVALTPLTTALLEVSRVQTIEAGSLGLWATVSVPAFPPAADDIENLAKLAAYRELIVADVADALSDRPEIRQRWLDHTDTEAARFLSEQTESAVAAGIGRSTIDPATWSYEQFLAEVERSSTEFTAFVDELSTAVRQFGVRNDEGATLRDQIFADVVGVAQEARSTAADEQRDALLRLFGAALITGLVVLVLSRFISGPARTMASSAQRLSNGDLAVDVPVRGPSEMREAATALNDSITSLRLVELQTVALADGDLDHPILAESTKGQLGSSVHRAVDRLRSALSLNETFRNRLAHEAAHDGLTGLPNRRSIMEQVEAALARAQRSSSMVSLLFLDLDEFKAINDTYGHRAGDALLREVSRRIRDTIRTGDIAGRLGGDEFVVLAEGHADVGEAVELAERIRAAILEPMDVDGATLQPQVSIGVALANNTDLTPEELVHDADLAVYRAKAAGTSAIQVCDEALRAEFAERSTIEAAIRAGLADDEFELHYQPTLDASTGAVVGLEALIRWRRPGFGLVAPDAFIPVAEQSNLIVSIDEWVLATTARQIEEWNREHDLGDLAISVNISSRHLASDTLLPTLDRVLEAHDIAPRQLMIEITESAFLSDLEDATHQLDGVQRRGVRVALDDFGTGYMSLGVLRALPVDTLKIDRSFVHRLDTDDERALVELIVGSGHILGLSITAEGVETDQQKAFLTDIGVDVMQGYLFSRPLAASEVRPYLGRGARTQVIDGALR